MKPAFQMERDVVWTGGEPATQGRQEKAAVQAAVARALRLHPGFAPTVENVMTRKVIVADPMFSAGRALALAERRGVTHLPVAWSDGEILGVVCICDLWAADEDELITHVMSLPVITVGAGQTLAEAADLMRSHDIGCLPVIDAADRLVGVITLGDLVRAGVLKAEDRAPACQACSSRHHVRTGVPVRTARSSATFCLRCLHSAAAPGRTLHAV